MEIGSSTLDWQRCHAEDGTVTGGNASDYLAVSTAGSGRGDYACLLPTLTTSGPWGKLHCAASTRSAPSDSLLLVRPRFRHECSSETSRWWKYSSYMLYEVAWTWASGPSSCCSTPSLTVRCWAGHLMFLSPVRHLDVATPMPPLD